jgi:L-aspartate oxidase
VTPEAPLDLLVLGSGVAGLSAAVRAAEAHHMQVGVLTKGELAQSTTRWAQGGVAAVLGGDPDSTDEHMADTLRAGAELCDVEAVRVLVDEGPGRVSELIALGAMFDRDATGRYLLAREGGHSHPRILHAGGAATGVEVERALVDAVRLTATTVLERWFALDLLVEGGRCAGVRAVDPQGNTTEVRATNVLVATGGAGQLYAVTTNPLESTGDGIAMGLRAGVATADVEFVQFHPTALHHPRMPRPLLSEALRGHGAVLRDRAGERFVDELLPRDAVSRAITARILDEGTEHVWLDVRAVEQFAQRFPTIAAILAEVGLDPTADWLPVAPAAHYLCGGLVTDLDGATSLPGLWGAGEATCTGVHGANRLASNSLLDGMVFGFRVVEAVEAGKIGPEVTGAMAAVLAGDDAPPSSIGARRLAPPVVDGVADPLGDASPEKLRAQLQAAMTAGAGVVRTAASLRDTVTVVDQVAATLASVETPPAVSRGHCEVANLVEVARATLTAAIAREESRGCHTRTDFPVRDDERFRCRLVL